MTGSGRRLSMTAEERLMVLREHEAHHKGPALPLCADERHRTARLYPALAALYSHISAITYVEGEASWGAPFAAGCGDSGAQLAVYLGPVASCTGAVQ